MSKKYNLRKDTDLSNITFEDILSGTKSLEKKAEPIDFSGFKTPSPSESLHLDKIFSTDSLTSGFSTPILTAPTIMELDIAAIKSEWESKKGSGGEWRCMRVHEGDPIWLTGREANSIIWHTWPEWLQIDFQ